MLRVRRWEVERKVQATFVLSPLEIVVEMSGAPPRSAVPENYPGESVAA